MMGWEGRWNSKKDSRSSAAKRWLSESQMPKSTLSGNVAAFWRVGDADDEARARPSHETSMAPAFAELALAS